MINVEPPAWLAASRKAQDWYGNARPLFVRGRIIALLGYELVEGNRQGESITEVRRVSFAPGRSQVAANSK